MKVLALSVLLLFISFSTFAFMKKNTLNSDTIPASFHDLTATGIEGAPLAMSDFKGKYVLCVNVASRCGYTPQYKPLQALYEQYGDQLVIIGFPCNQFLMQEPGSAEAIASFCERNYGVTFPLTEKIKVKGKNQHPVYAWLTKKELNGVSDAKIGWNFNKILVSPDGEWLGHFSSNTDPLSDEIIKYFQ